MLCHVYFTKMRHLYYSWCWTPPLLDCCWIYVLICVCLCKCGLRMCADLTTPSYLAVSCWLAGRVQERGTCAAASINPLGSCSGGGLAGRTAAAAGSCTGRGIEHIMHGTRRVRHPTSNYPLNTASVTSRVTHRAGPFNTTSSICSSRCVWDRTRIPVKPE